MELQSLSDIEDIIGHIAAIFFGGLAVLVFGRWLLNTATNIAAGISFRFKGFSQYKRVEIDGHLATISGIGALTTHFKLKVRRSNGKTYERYRTVDNSRLSALNICQLVEVDVDQECEE